MNSVTNVVEATLRNGGVMLVIATESHHASIGQRLRSDGVDLEAAIGQSCYIPLDLTDSPSAVRVQGRSIDVAHSLVAEAVRAAEEKQLHVAVG